MIYGWLKICYIVSLAIKTNDIYKCRWLKPLLRPENTLFQTFWQFWYSLSLFLTKISSKLYQIIFLKIEETFEMMEFFGLNGYFNTQTMGENQSHHLAFKEWNILLVSFFKTFTFINKWKANFSDSLKTYKHTWFEVGKYSKHV